MRVMTMHGGFRGLGALTTGRRLEAEEGFNRRFADFYAAAERFQGMSAEGQIPARLYDPYAERYQQLDSAIADHHNAIDLVDDEESLREWQRGARRLEQRAREWMTQVRQIMGETVSGRGLRLALLATASIAVVGGTAWWVTQVWGRG